MRATDGDDLVDLTATPSEPAARAIVAALQEVGIDASVVGGMLAGFRAEAPAAARVIVHRRDLAEGRSLLAGLCSEAAAIDWDEVDVGEPEGGVDADGRCFACKYDLAGLERRDRCPECGAWLRGGVEPGGALAPMLKHAGRRRVWLLVLLAIGLCVAGAIVALRNHPLSFMSEP